ncbi:MAG: MBL fold metallo-hydrolase, partial [Verrucomicrobiae bacterium]|nr:MBL fold metallo-hydrolase [Verrucomicrobiae bacterium]
RRQRPLTWRAALAHFWAERKRPVAIAPCRPRPSEWRKDAISAANLGHATVLINFYGTWIVTDPVFSERVGIATPFGVVGPKRWIAPALRPADFPSPSLILISHAHFDHLDLPSLRKLDRAATIVTASSTADLFRRLRFRRVVELAWGESTEVGGVRVEAVEVNHWGARVMRDQHRGHNGYWLEKNGEAIFFAGDTARAQIRRPKDAAGELRAAFLPIGAYDPWIRAHCTPEEAAEMGRGLGAEIFLPLHFEVFELSNEPFEEPIQRLKLAWPAERIGWTRIGETWIGETWRRLGSK